MVIAQEPGSTWGLGHPTAGNVVDSIMIQTRLSKVRGFLPVHFPAEEIA
jgi:hypothetical protein